MVFTVRRDMPAGNFRNDDVVVFEIVLLLARTVVVVYEVVISVV